MIATKDECVGLPGISSRSSTQLRPSFLGRLRRARRAGTAPDFDSYTSGLPGLAPSPAHPLKVVPVLSQSAGFVVRRPRFASAAPATGPGIEGKGPAPQPAASRILVVDDNVDSADSMALLLSLDGHEVRTAFDGPGALSQAAGFQPRAVLLDIGLPGMDGYEVARRMRELPGLRDVLMIAITGYGQEEDRTRSKAAGFDHHLVKPVDPDTLSRLLGNLD